MAAADREDVRLRFATDLRVKDLGDEDLLKLRDYIDEHFRVEGDLRREVAGDIRRKIEIGCYQGLRHRRGLPVHGQRTRTNARSSQGPRMGSFIALYGIDNSRRLIAEALESVAA